MRSLLLAAVAVAALSGHARAQGTSLANLWMEVKVKATGYSVPVVGAADAATLKTTAYLRLEQGSLPPLDDVGGSGPVYDWTLWTLQDEGWAVSDSGTVFSLALGTEDHLATDLALELQLAGGARLLLQGTVLFRPKVSGSGQLQGGKLKWLAGQVTDGSTDGEDVFAGSFTAKGHYVHETELPFVPD